MTRSAKEEKTYRKPPEFEPDTGDLQARATQFLVRHGVEMMSQKITVRVDRISRMGYVFFRHEQNKNALITAEFRLEEDGRIKQPSGMFVHF